MPNPQPQPSATTRPEQLIDVAAERLTMSQGQIDLLGDPAKQRQRQLDDVADRINDKYGKRAIRRSEPACRGCQLFPRVGFTGTDLSGETMPEVWVWA
jgi:hypothetical protein